MSDKTHWKKLTNPDYLGAYAFQPGEEKTLLIKEVRREMVFNPSSGSKEECTVCHFEGPVKPLILNVTNCKAIAKVWGTPYIEDWAGRKITLKVKKVKAFGEMIDAVRVSDERPADDAVCCEVCGNHIMAAAGRTAVQIVAITKSKYGKALCLECAKKEAN